MSLHTVAKEPFIRIAKREGCTVRRSILVYFLGLLGGLLVSAVIIMLITGLNPLEVYASMLRGTLDFEAIAQGKWNKLWYALRDTALLLCIGVGLAPAFKMRFWNIGAEGQMLMGGLVSAACMINLSDLPNPLLLLIMAAASIAAGALWGFLPAVFKAKFGTNETLFTLMMNYIAIQLTLCCVDEWKGSNVSLGLLNPDTQAGYVSQLFGNPYGAVILIAAIAVLCMSVYLSKTKQGFEISVVGDSPNTARYAGMNTFKIVMRTAFISGAICGLVGMLYVSCVDHTLSSTIGGNYGFTAIIVAWAAKFNPVIMVLISMAIVFFERGAAAVNDTTSALNSYTAYVIVAIFLIFIIGCEFFVNYKIVYNEKVVAAYKKFHDKVEAKAPWLTAACAWCAAAIHKFSMAIEKTLAYVEDKLKVGASRVAHAAFDCIVDAVSKCVFRIRLWRAERKRKSVGYIRHSEESTETIDGENGEGQND